LKRGERKKNGEKKRKKGRHTLITTTCTTLPTKAHHTASIAIVNNGVSLLKVAACAT